MPKQDIDCRCEDTTLRGLHAFNEGAGPRPVFHEGLGLAIEKARQLASLGYVALAADMFGERLATIAGLPQVDRGRLAAIGFCFGGSVVLEQAKGR